MTKFQALGSAFALALAGAIVAVPAMARTHHPSTSGERAQTRDLNLQQLAIAQGQAPANQQATNANAQPSQNPNQNQNVPSDQMMNGGQTAQAPGATQSAAPPAEQPAAPPASNSQAPSGQ